MSYYETTVSPMEYIFYDEGRKKIQHGYEFVATYMKAEINGIINKGSSPKKDAFPNIFRALKLNFQDETYVRGHLLNENFGGEGDLQNLFPITDSANKSHRGIESVVENLIDKITKMTSNNIKKAYENSELIPDKFGILASEKLRSAKMENDKLNGEYIIQETRKNKIGNIYAKDDEIPYIITYSVLIIPERKLSTLHPNCKIHCDLETEEYDYENNKTVITTYIFPPVDSFYKGTEIFMKLVPPEYDPKTMDESTFPEIDSNSDYEIDLNYFDNTEKTFLDDIYKFKLNSMFNLMTNFNANNNDYKKFLMSIQEQGSISTDGKDFKSTVDTFKSHCDVFCASAPAHAKRPHDEITPDSFVQKKQKL